MVFDKTVNSEFYNSVKFNYEIKLPWKKQRKDRTEKILIELGYCFFYVRRTGISLQHKLFLIQIYIYTKSMIGRLQQRCLFLLSVEKEVNVSTAGVLENLDLSH